MANYQPGNKMPLGGSTGPNSTRSREDQIIDKTKALAFPDDGILPLENFEHCGDMAAGSENSLGAMQALTGKALQESYRVGAHNQRGMSSYTDKVSDR